MDITLIKTFLEVAASGSFVAAAERLFVTQSAVSLRVLRLEESLGRPVFTRSKAGAEMTRAGREFQPHALRLITIWEEARQQIAIPADFIKTLTIGAHHSLWPQLGFGWIDQLKQRMPRLSLRTELGMPDRLTRQLTEGGLQAALMYAPHLRAGLSAEKLLEDELILVAPWPNPTMDLKGRYLCVDWGPEFLQQHAMKLPHMTNPGLTFALDALAAEYIMSRNYAAYLPARFVSRDIADGHLHVISTAPVFPLPVWSVWRDDLDPEVAEIAHAALNGAVQDIARE